MGTARPSRATGPRDAPGRGRASPRRRAGRAPALEAYHRKRDFGRTPEPRGEHGTGTGTARRFVVHKHAARRLHYDLRLEHDGVFESWAVPKGPALAPGARRLAVRVEDHPLEYGDFEGVIPAGEYGGGTVMLWDAGALEVKRRQDDRLDFVLHGRKLEGAWSLVRMHGRAGGDGRNWLMIKRSDAGPARAAGTPDDRSVRTGRTMEQIAADRDRTWGPAGEDSRPAAVRAASIAGARRKAIPRLPEPQLATLVAEVPRGPGWLHEIKFDGYRVLATVVDGEARLYSRNGKEWTARFPEFAEALAGLPVTDAVLDGEAIAVGADGISSFRRLQDALGEARTSALSLRLFDLTHLDGHDLSRVPLVERKRALESILRSAGLVGHARVLYTDHIDGGGEALHAHACRLGLEGIVSKRADAPYRAGRNAHWLKVKCTRHEELVIGGYTDPTGARSGFGALLLGGWRDGRLIYAGKVGTGFSARVLGELGEALAARQTRTSPFDPPPPGRAHWVKPDLVAEVEFTEWTRDGALRHPSFRGLREDRDAETIRLPGEIGQGSDDGGTVRAARSKQAVKRVRRGRADAASKAGAGTGGGEEARVAGVPLTHPERVLFPDQGVTKLALARYYEEVADVMLPQLVERPLSLLRCPQGSGEACFFQKHPGESMARGMGRIEIAEKSGNAVYLYVRTLADLVALVQAGTLELHVWGSRIRDVERPDIVVFDLDPGPGVRWSRMIATARSLRERLLDLGLESYVRTTGGKGLHLVVPILPEREWDEVKAFAHAVAQAHAADDPDGVTTNMAKAKRQDRIFLDYLRNGRGATAIASYSTRAREGAPVSVPLRWDELGPELHSDRYTVCNLRRRLAALRADPWPDFERARARLKPQMLRALKVGAR